MCRLLAQVSSLPTQIEAAFFNAPTPFVSFHRTNPDGWGVGWYSSPDLPPPVFKEGAAETRVFSFERAREATSRMVLAHVRKASLGLNTKTRNAHPFRLGQWLFAHNGTMDRMALGKALKKPWRSRRVSDTDSERLFLLILQHISGEKEDLPGASDPEVVTTAVAATIECARQRSFTALNFLLADGRYLFAFREIAPHDKEHPLHYLSGPACERLVGIPAVIVSSEPLTLDSWDSIESKTLICVEENLQIRHWQL